MVQLSPFHPQFTRQRDVEFLVNVRLRQGLDAGAQTALGGYVHRENGEGRTSASAFDTSEFSGLIAPLGVRRPLPATPENGSTGPANGLASTFRTQEHIGHMAALIRRLLEQDQIAAAKRVLNAIPDLSDPQVRRLARVLGTPRVTARPAARRDRRAEFALLAQKGNNYRGKWVALLGDQVLGAEPKLRTLLERLRSTGNAQDALIHHIDE